MTLHSLQALQRLEQTLREEFAERLRGVERERDEWKAKFEQAEQDGNSWTIKYQQEQLKVQNLEALQRTTEIQTTDIVARNAKSPLIMSTSPELKGESPEISPEPSTSNPEKYADLKRRYRVLQRKYDQLDTWYKEAKTQLSSVKTELATRTEAWRAWHEWWTTQRHHLRLKSTSPTKNQDENINIDGQTEHSESRSKDKMDVVGEDTLLDGHSRTTNSPDKAESTEINNLKSQVAHTKRTHSNDEIDAFPQVTLDNAELALPSGVTIHITNAMETEVETTSKPEVIEIFDVPESPIAKVTRVALPLDGGQASLITITSSPAASPSKPSITSSSGRFKLCSTRTSEPKKKKREYPNMKYFTEDGTDGINPQPDSPNYDEDDGTIAALLEGRPPPPLTKATPLPRPKTSPPAPITPALTSRPNSKRRTRELIELDSDSGSSSSGANAKRQKTEQVNSEPRVRREIFSPGHAAKNKGRGRYSESFSVRNIGDPPRLQDFIIDPANNQGVSHPFNDVVRGKEARRSLPATVCQDCAKFHEFHGPTSGANTCNHIQQVSRHRQQWEPLKKPLGYWNSHFPTEEELEQNRAETERLEAERLKKIAEEAARGDGRWKKRNT